jgi:putative hydrolase of the HAD superfamily
VTEVNAIATDTPCVWVFDLDNTLYPAGSTLYEDVGRRMTAYIARELKLATDAATALREHYFHTYGATVIGLMRDHDIDGVAFMQDVHDVTLHDIGPDARLISAIEALDGRKIVYTNGARDYARRVIDAIGMTHVFEAVTSLEDLDFTPKPLRQSFEAFCRLHKIEPQAAHFFDDHPENINTAAAMGFHAHFVGPPGASAQGRPARALIDVLHSLHHVTCAGNAT